MAATMRARGLGISIGLIAAVVSLILAAGAQAAPGDLDPTFSGDGIQMTHFRGDDEAADVALQGNGKIVAVGQAGAPQTGFAIARYKSDGSLDSSFSGDGKRILDFGGYSAARGVAIQPNGKIVAVGYGAPAQTGGSERFAIARFNSNGTLDTSFSGDGRRTTGFRDYALGSGVVLQNDGKIIVVGRSGAGTYDGVHCCGSYSFALARYNPDGSLDTSFSGDGRQMTRFGEGFSGARGVALQGRKIVVVGSGGPYASDFAIARYNPDGSLDPRFSGDGKQTTDFRAIDEASDVALQDGKIVAVGSSVHPNGGGGVMARYNLNGTLDASFDGDGKQTNAPGPADALVAAPGGKIVVVGGNDFAIARYNPNGSLDASFGDGGTQTINLEGAAHGVALQPDGKIVAAGIGRGPTETDFALVRYLGG